MKGALKVGERADQSAGVKAVALAVVRVFYWAVQWDVELAVVLVAPKERQWARLVVPMADAKAYQKDDELDVVKVGLKDETRAAYLVVKWASPWGVWELYWVGE